MVMQQFGSTGVSRVWVWCVCVHLSDWPPSSSAASFPTYIREGGEGGGVEQEGGGGEE